MSWLPAGTCRTNEREPAEEGLEEVMYLRREGSIAGKMLAISKQNVVSCINQTKGQREHGLENREREEGMEEGEEKQQAG